MAPRLFSRQRPIALGRSKPFTAAALPLTLSGRKEGIQAATASLWQQQAWSFFDQIGEVRYGARYYGNSLSRLRLQVGWRDTPGEAVVPVDPDEPPEGLDGTQFELAQMTLNRLHSTDGAVSEILRAFGVNHFVAGEGYLVGRTDQETETERWDFLSVDQVVLHEGRWKLKMAPNDPPGRYLALDPDGDVVIRVWLPHPRFANDADSPMRAVLPVCEELLLLSAAVRASAMSRIPAGILILPDTMLEGGPDGYNGDGTDGEAQADRTLDDIVRHFVTPIQDPESASAVVPHILALDPQDADKVRLIEPSRKVDEIAAAQRGELLVRLANGVDLPPEVLQGMSGTNHWSAWLIDEQSFKTHIAPAASLFCGAVTEGLLWPAIRAAGMDPDVRLVVTFDPAELVTHPDRKANAKDGHDSLVISDRAYRRALGFAEEDAPDDDEYVRRMALQQGALQLAPVAAGEIDSVVESIETVTTPGTPPRRPLPGSAPVVPVGDDASGVQPGPPVEPVVAAAVQGGGEFTELVGRLDRQLIDQVDSLAAAALRRAIEKANARVRSRVARDQDLADVLAASTSLTLSAMLGRDKVGGVYASDEEDGSEEALLALFAGAFDEFGDSFDELVNMTQTRSRQTLANRYGLSEVEAEVMQTAQDQERSDARAWVAAALTALAVSRLFDPAVSTPGAETRAGLTGAPADMLREALARAGGGTGTVTRGGGLAGATGQPSGLVATGSTVRSFAGKVGLQQVGFIWDYGDGLRKTFEPHLMLDGLEFAGWEDAGLANYNGWPPDPFFYPGDHQGCMCLDRPIYRAVVEGADEEDPGLLEDATE
jgi:hypothetical protein